MKINSELLILVGLLILMYVNPSLMATFVNNVLGKVFLLAGIVYLTEKNTILGLLLAVIFIASMQTNEEGMDNSGKAASLAAAGAKSGGVDATGSPKPPTAAAPKKGKKPATTQESLATLKPAVITSGRELLSLDEMLRPTESNMLPVNKPMGSPPSENLLDGQLDLMNPVRMNGTINRGYLPAIF